MQTYAFVLNPQNIFYKNPFNSSISNKVISLNSRITPPTAHLLGSHTILCHRSNIVWGILLLSAARTADVPPIGQSKSHCHGGGGIFKVYILESTFATACMLSSVPKFSASSVMMLWGTRPICQSIMIF